MDEEFIHPVYRVEDNYKSLNLYGMSTRKEFDKMLLHGVVEKVAVDSTGVWHPMGAVIKNSDKRRSLVLGQ